jgi:hypothetical protein
MTHKHVGLAWNKGTPKLIRFIQHLYNEYERISDNITIMFVLSAVVFVPYWFCRLVLATVFHMTYVDMVSQFNNGASMEMTFDTRFKIWVFGLILTVAITIGSLIIYGIVRLIKAYREFK